MAEYQQPGNRYTSHSVRGGAFCLDVADGVPAVWGSGSQVGWAVGEPFILVGPDGVGKTTLIQQLVLGMVGLVDEVLGLPVKQVERVLYFAIDRWRQAQRSFHRMVTEDQRKVLDKRLVVVKGSLPAMLDTEPKILAAMAKELGAGAVILDSLKDAARKIGTDETGSAVIEAFRYCGDADVEVGANHHQRKQGQGTGPPTTLDDVYGSRLIPGGCGSVVLLWGKAGDPLVKLTHLKQPAEEIGPWEILHDHAHGVSSRVLSIDLVVLAGAEGGITAQKAAAALYSHAEPSRGEIERARRRLETLERQSRLRKCSTNGSKESATYFPYVVDLSDD